MRAMRRTDRLPPGFTPLMAAQFVSALADNALLIVAMARLQASGSALWWAPLLKFSLTLAYVLLAPVVGPLADAVPKARLMMAMNGVKVLGVAWMLGGGSELLAFAIVGVGAAAYAPAKYGLVTELVPAHLMVRANGWIEVATVGAVLLGAVLGGVLISPVAQTAYAALDLGLAPLQVATALMLLAYALAALLNLAVPDSGARYRRSHRAPRALWRGFWRAQRRLWGDGEGALSMAATTLFWGAASVLQFAVLRWAEAHLGLDLHQAAYLQAAVAVGIVAGAAVAARAVRLSDAPRLLPVGIGMGLTVPLAAALDDWVWALPALVVVGAFGGALVVPLNALLQHRGHVLLSAGRSIAVQNFNENLSILVMLAVYAGLLAAGVEVRVLMAALGLLVAAVLALLMRWWQRRAARGEASNPPPRPALPPAQSPARSAAQSRQSCR